MLAKKYNSKLISISNPFEGIYTLEFESKRGRYKYSPGQFLHLALDDSYDGVGQWPDSRCFSMQSNPDENNIRITYAVIGTFTKEMEAILKVGSEVWLKLPYGNLFSQPHKKNNTIFIAGRTGITPFLSLYAHRSFYEYKKPKIFLGFRSREYNIFEEELSTIQNDDAEISLFYEDKVGLIDINLIYESFGTDSTYFISGPPRMIKTFRNDLIRNGVGIHNIITDDWE